MGNFLSLLLFGIPSILIAFIIHEVGHAYVAYFLGDPTAKYQGRLSFNPKVHIDPVGAGILLITLIMSGGHFAVGWAKPVPFNPSYLKNPLRDGMLIALAGAASNFLLAAFCGMFLKLGILFPDNFLGYFVLVLVTVNIALGIFNLLPIPPLDGWKVLQGILPRETAYRMMELEYRNPQITIMILIFAVMLLNVTPLGDLLIGLPFALLLKLFTTPF